MTVKDKPKITVNDLGKLQIPRDNHDDRILREISRSNEKVLPLIQLKDELSSFGLYESRRLHERLTHSRTPAKVNVYVYSDKDALESGLADAANPGDIYINAAYKEKQLPHEIKHAENQIRGTNRIAPGRLGELSNTHRLMLNAATEESIAILFSIIKETEEPKAKDMTALLLERLVGHTREEDTLKTKDKISLIIEGMIKRTDSGMILGLYDAIAQGTLDGYLEKFEGDKTPTVATGIYGKVHELGTALLLIRCISPGSYKNMVGLYHEAITDLIKEHQSGTSLDFAENTIKIIRKDGRKGKSIRKVLASKIDWVELEVLVPETLTACRR